MNLTIIPITPESRARAEALCVGPGQENYIETVAQCMREADRRKCWRPVGIYDGTEMVGFAMYGFFREYLPFGRVWLDRLLIDRRFQGRGYGRAAVELLLERLHREYRCKRIYLSVYGDNGAAIALYRKLGFRFNGQRDVHGEKVMRYDFAQGR